MPRPKALDKSQKTRQPAARRAAPKPADPDESPDVGSALRQLRLERRLSLDKLAYESGVSRAMLSQIELGRSVPTITLLWRIARALAVPFSALLSGHTDDEPMILHASRAKVLRSADGSFSTRALFPLDQLHTAEFYELHLAPQGAELADPHAPGTTENIVVTAGILEIRVASRIVTLRPGDATYFRADVAHEYHNPGKHEAIAYLVMTYAHPA